MGVNEAELEEQLKEAGNLLLNPPPSLEDLHNLLDKLERFLNTVEQAPSRSMQDSLLPPMKALISSALLRHSDEDVKISVASCISELTRITAPDAPYNDDQMKEIFHLFVAASKKLSYVSSRCYKKAVSIIDTIAKVRSCLVMLDLEMDELIIEMFQHFLKTIRSNHPHALFLAMETIMTLVIDESEDISLHLLTPLLASVENKTQSVSPVAWKLAEKVMTNCASKLKPYLKGAVQSLSLMLDDYAPIVASICRDDYHTLGCNHVNGSSEHLVTEGLSLNAGCPRENFQAVDGFSKSVASEETASIRNPGTIMHNGSPNVLEDFAKHLKSTDELGNAEPEVKLEMETKNVPRKRGRKPNPLFNLEEGYDQPWVCTGRKIVKLPQGRMCQYKGFDGSPAESPFPKGIPQSLTHAHLIESVGYVAKTGENKGASSTLPKRSCPGRNHSKKDRPKEKGSLMNKDFDTSSLFLSKEIEVEKKAFESDDIRKGKKFIKRNTSQKEDDFKGEPVKERPHQSMKLGSRSIIKDRLSAPYSKRCSTETGTSHEDVAEASGNMNIKSSTQARRHEGPSKTTLKATHTAKKEVPSESPYFEDRLIGCRIKIWWPRDKKFYEGIVDFYNPVQKKHHVLYDDGDEELLNLKRQRWELVGGNSLHNEGPEAGIWKHSASSDVMQKVRGKPKSRSPKQLNAYSSSRRRGNVTVSKTRAGRSGSKTGAVPSNHIVSDKPFDDICISGRPEDITPSEYESPSDADEFRIVDRPKVEPLLFTRYK